MIRYTEQEKQWVNEGRDALVSFAGAYASQRRCMYRIIVATFLAKLAKQKPGPDGVAFFLDAVVAAAVHMLAKEGAFDEAHKLLDELGTLEDIDGTRIAATPEVCLSISDLRKALATYEAGPDAVADHTAIVESAKKAFGTHEPSAL
jgi:hypothetical protein